MVDQLLSYTHERVLEAIRRAIPPEEVERRLAEIKRQVAGRQR